MAGWLGPARQTYYYVNDDGVLTPAAGWLLWHYIPGSDDLKDTWETPEEGDENLNTNPVILDENGQASIYGNGLYRQRFTDADETVEVWDRVTTADGGGGTDPTPYTDYFDMPFECLGDPPAANQLIGAFIFTRAGQIPADFDGSADDRPSLQGWQVTPPADADATITVKRGTKGASVGSEVTIGTITVTMDAGVWSGETTGNLPQAFDAGDYVKFYADVADSEWADIFWTCPGEVL